MGLTLSTAACSTVRQVDDLQTAPSDGVALVRDTDESLSYTVAVDIAAPKEKVWATLTDVDGYGKWNTTLVSIKGDIAAGGEVEMVPKIAPDQTFSVKVSEFKANERMVWEDGMPMGFFSGVRTYTLAEGKNGSTRFVMSEVFSGGMLGMIKGSLPDFKPAFESFAADLKKEVEKE